MAWAIPPNTPITNTANVQFEVSGVGFGVAGSNTLITDANAGNSPPFALALDQPSIDENLNGVPIGRLLVSDLDPSDTHTFVLSDPRFVVVGDVLQLAAGQSLDFETQPQVLLDVSVTDSQGAQVTLSLTVVVNDVNEAPTALTIDRQTFTADQPGAVVGTLTVVDPDQGDVHSFTVDDPRFAVLGNTLQLIDSESLPLGTVVSLVITATDQGGLTIDLPLDVTATPPGGGAGTGSSIQVLQSAESVSGAQPFNVQTAQCDAGSGLADVGPLQSIGGQVQPLPQVIELLQNQLLKAGNPLIVQVTDADANLDANNLDQIAVTVSSDNGDSETLVIFETAINSGVFIGHLPTRRDPASLSGNCQLEADVAQTLTVFYVDANDAGDSAVIDVLVDPFGLVFDSASGRPVNGATITLLDGLTNTPAQVFADDGVSAFPSSQTSGDNNFALADGNYRFPFVAAGQYRLQVTPPNRFRFPTSIADDQLQLLPAAPFALGAAARGEVFDVPLGPAVRVDIPLDLLPVVPTDSALEVLVFNPAAAGVTSAVQPTMCLNGDQFIDAGNPNTFAQGALALPATISLTQADRFSRGDVVFIRLQDPDQDLDPFAPDQVMVNVRVPGQVDVEQLQLTETNDSTGEFVGFIQTSPQAAQANNCQLEAPANAQFEVSYTDAADSQDTSTASALLDPGFTVFSSQDGSLLDGAQITLLDQNGVPLATVTSGAETQDNNGNVIDFAPGTFFFPNLAPGEYRLQVTPPVSFNFPSQIGDDTLNELDGGPYLLTPGSRGDTFVFDGVASPAFDVPLDPISAQIVVTKQASKDVVSIGDFLQYQISVSNSDLGGTVSQVRLLDRLPLGFRYASGSLQINGNRADDPEIASNGRDLSVALPDLAPQDSVDIRYVAEVTAGAELGAARNAATVQGIGVGNANTAFADVLVREDLLQSTVTLVGRVVDGECGEADAPGLADVRVWLETGSFAVTDAQGKFHFEGIEPGTHVVQLDQASLPPSHEIAACESNTRFAGSGSSQFVDLQPGSLWRTDFYVRLKPDSVSQITSNLDARAHEGRVTYRYRLRGGDLALQKFRTTVMLDEQLAYVEGSAALNGQSIEDPSGIEQRALTFELPDNGGAFDYVLTFDTFVTHPNGLIETRAISQFRSAAGRHRTPVNQNEISVNWPSSLVVVAESLDSGALNKAALRKARQANARRLPKVEQPEEQSSAPQRSVKVVSEVLEPSRGAQVARSQTQLTTVSVATEAELNQPYELPALDKGKAPRFDLAWLRQQSGESDIAWPPQRYNPSIPAVALAVVHDAALKPQVLVDGELINPLTYDGTVVDHERGLAVTSWDGVSISEADSLIEARLLDLDGVTVSSMRRPVHYSGAPVRAEVVKDHSYLMANGLHPPVVAVRLFDRDGYPLRAGVTGEFVVSAPYQSLDKARHLESINNDFNNQRYQVLRDGIAYIQLQPTTETGEVELRFQFDQVRSQVVRARLEPGLRDWILVGLVEGSLNDNNLSGNLQSLDELALEDRTLSDGRVAFYAKGLIKGEWLLTTSYDTDKRFERRLREQIDPNQFYTLYGDGSAQLFDAQSQRKLYLKLERRRFSALFGDFDTEFSRSELARYERRINGANIGYFGRRVEVNAFASETDQAFVRDEIRGDGTSGVYRLSNQRVVENSETIRIVTRARFTTENVLESTTLTRFLDYTIDYDLGTLIFKQPVFSQDDQFNPIIIEAEYEIADEAAGDDLVAGVRAAYRLDDQESEVALTYVNDGTQGRGGELLAADLTWQLSQARKLTVEVAQSDTDLEGQAEAYLVELEHRTDKIAGRVYFREQQAAFGLGLQSLLESGTRKYGVEGEYRLSDQILLRGQSFQQTVLAQGNDRFVMNGEGEFQWGAARFTSGFQTVREDSFEGEQRTANQLTLGAVRGVLGNRLQLRANAEVDLSSQTDSADFPSRAILGADYEVLPGVSILTEQEFTWADDRNTQDSRVGLRARPWTGADISSVVSRQFGENGERLFATTGLLQQWRLNERWLFDIGVDRVQTLRESGSPDDEQLLFNPNVPAASGSFENDFTAFFTGVGYRYNQWDISSRIELHQGDDADRVNYLFGANHQLADGKVVSASAAVFNEEGSDGRTQDNADIRVGLAWRPDGSRWTFLNRADLVFERRQDSSFDTRTRKWVNNFNANYKHEGGHQLSLQLGFKYVLDEFDGVEFDSTTALYGAEYRYDFLPKWDLGLRASTLQSFASNVIDRSAGVSIGHNAFKDFWVSVGYNFTGFDDDDFVDADYSAKGLFLRLRLKLDQELIRRFTALATGRREQRGPDYSISR